MARNWTSGDRLWLLVTDETSAQQLFERGHERGLWSADKLGVMFVFDDECTDICLGGQFGTERVMTIRLQ